MIFQSHILPNPSGKVLVCEGVACRCAASWYPKPNHTHTNGHHTTISPPHTHVPPNTSTYPPKRSRSKRANWNLGCLDSEMVDMAVAEVLRIRYTIICTCTHGHENTQRTIQQRALLHADDVKYCIVVIFHFSSQLQYKPSKNITLFFAHVGLFCFKFVFDLIFLSLFCRKVHCYFCFIWF